MNDALKRIEEKHSGTVHSDTLTVCDFCHRRHPCDVVKLARALDEIRRECMCREHRALAQRTLEEVAGE